MIIDTMAVIVANNSEVNSIDSHVSLELWA
jgi:hypothetical protein